MSPKPTLGYGSRTAAVQALRDQNLSTAEIADRIGIDRNTVAALESSAKRWRRTAQSNRTVLFPIEVLDQFGPHAARRGITANELVRRVVEAVIDGRLVDAVLDDEADVRAYLALVGGKA